MKDRPNLEESMARLNGRSRRTEPLNGNSPVAVANQLDRFYESAAQREVLERELPGIGAVVSGRRQSGRRDKPLAGAFASVARDVAAIPAAALTEARRKLNTGATTRATPATAPTISEPEPTTDLRAMANGLRESVRPATMPEHSHEQVLIEGATAGPYVQLEDAGNGYRCSGCDAHFSKSALTGGSCPACNRVFGSKASA